MNKLVCGLVGIPLLILAGGVVPASAQTDDPAVNRLLAAQCAQCHGTDGYARAGFEDLAGEEAKDLFEDLMDMKGEDKPENIMDHQALGYTDDQIRRIARYYSSLPEDQPGQASSEDSRNDSEQVRSREKDEDEDKDQDD
jgi:sulfide dehydrogenase cytochrome subunit